MPRAQEAARRAFWSSVLEKRMALLEGGPELGGLGVASGTNAAFYAIINLAQTGDNIVSARNLYA